MKSNHDIFSRVPIFVLIAALFVSACAARAPAPPMSAEKGMYHEEYDVATDRGFAPVPEQPASPQGAAEYASTKPSSSERMVIKNATLSLIVKDPPAAMETIAKLAEEMGGFVVSANLYKTETSSGKEIPQASITIRIPAEKLNQALDEIKALSKELPQRENLTSQDITAEYTDLDSRLRNLKRAEEQLQEILDQAYSTEDVLSVYQQLTQVREQIEVIEGQMKYYREAVALSSISVELIAEEAVEPLTIGQWKPVGVARDALQALINAVQFLLNVAIWVVIFVLPVLLLAYVIFFIPLRALWRVLRRRRQLKSKPAEPPSPPTVT